MFRTDATQKIKVMIEGIYSMGVGYHTIEGRNTFNEMVKQFCDVMGLPHIGESCMSGPQSKGDEIYAYFMGMEVVFETTDKADYKALALAKMFEVHIAKHPEFKGSKLINYSDMK